MFLRSADGMVYILNGIFRDFMEQAASIRLSEPLAETLGAFTAPDAVLEYRYTDVVKLAGHSCPTVTGAWLCCQEALARLYPDAIPVRGEISITVYGEPDEGVYGVMSQVFGFITGAATVTGFKGLGPRFRRKDLLVFSSEKPDPEALCFRFTRQDSSRSVMVKFYPWLIPLPQDAALKTAELMEKVVSSKADVRELEEFQELWMEKIKLMLTERKEIESWLKVEDIQEKT